MRLQLAPQPLVEFFHGGKIHVGYVVLLELVVVRLGLRERADRYLQEAERLLLRLFQFLPVGLQPFFQERFAACRPPLQRFPPKGREERK